MLDGDCTLIRFIVPVPVLDTEKVKIVLVEVCTEDGLTVAVQESVAQTSPGCKATEKRSNSDKITNANPRVFGRTETIKTIIYSSRFNLPLLFLDEKHIYILVEQNYVLGYYLIKHGNDRMGIIGNGRSNS